MESSWPDSGEFPPQSREGYNNWRRDENTLPFLQPVGAGWWWWWWAQGSAQWGLKVPEGQASCHRQKRVGNRGRGCRLRPYLALTVDLGPSIDQDLHNLQVAEPGRQEECVHPKLGERTQERKQEGGEERGGGRGVAVTTWL